MSSEEGTILSTLKKTSLFMNLYVWSVDRTQDNTSISLNHLEMRMKSKDLSKAWNQKWSTPQLPTHMELIAVPPTFQSLTWLSLASYSMLKFTSWHTPLTQLQATLKQVPPYAHHMTACLKDYRSCSQGLECSCHRRSNGSSSLCSGP
jgi:hypothetical protein